MQLLSFLEIMGSYFPMVNRSCLSKVNYWKNRRQKINGLKINESETLYRYAEGKWTIKEILQHVNDTERIFCYRALAFARREQSILPGFSENQYAANSHANDLSWSSLLNDFKIARKNSISLFSSFNNDDLNFIGKVSDYSISVRALGFAIAGHCIHHMNIVKERYLSIA